MSADQACWRQASSRFRWTPHGAAAGSRRCGPDHLARLRRSDRAGPRVSPADPGHGPSPGGPADTPPDGVALLLAGRPRAPGHRHELGRGEGTVRTISRSIRKRLAVDDLDAAAGFVQDRLARYRGTLPFSGRPKRRAPADGSPFSEPPLAVLRLMAGGEGCLAIAAALGEDRSTISPRVRQPTRRLGVESRREAIAKATGMGLVA